MVVFPCAKINLGLQVVGVRENGYHDIETVFYPIPLHDALEITPMDDEFPSDTRCDIKITGNFIPGKDTDNLVVKAYKLLANDFDLPKIHIHLFKQIPTQAGLGGGSSDAAYMLKLLNEQFSLNLTVDKLKDYAARLGADCAFFIKSEPCFASGIGDVLEPISNSSHLLKGFKLALIKPDIAISTQRAYQQINVKKTSVSCKDIIHKPIKCWKDELFNDFETPVFQEFPELKVIKEQLYQQGAIYASMSGSGSAIYGIFEDEPKNIRKLFDSYFTEVLTL